MTYALTTQKLFDGEQWLEQHCIVIKDGLIRHVMPSNQLDPSVTLVPLGTGIVAPGFIDLQVNGGGGVLLSESPCVESVNTITAAHRAGGTTAMMPTVLSETLDTQKASVRAVRDAQQQGNSGVLGIHLEGPFFDREKRGVHSEKMLRKMTQSDITWLCSLRDLRVIVTLAPEHVPVQHLQLLANSGIHVFAGHTNASYEQLDEATNHGLTGYTHLFNAMSSITAREPGAVGAALANDDVWVGIIADNQHVHPANIKIADRAKPPGKLFLVTDAMATVGSDKGAFTLYGEQIQQRNGKLVNSKGVLAGSAIGMIDAVRVAHTLVGLPLERTLQMASSYPAAVLGCDQKLGFIKPGYRADLVHFDATFNVHNTWVAGCHQNHECLA